MTWKQRQALELCCRSGCPLKAATGENYCGPHGVDQRKRAKISARGRRAAEKRQLRMDGVS